jgi:hypothetical protein
MPESIFDEKANKILIPTDNWIDLLLSIHGKEHNDQKVMETIIENLRINIPKKSAELFIISDLP